MENIGNTTTLKPIVLHDLVREKNPRLAAGIPNFVYGLMNKLLHIGEVNEITRKFGHLHGIPFITEVLNYFSVKVTCHGQENVPSSGRFIFASNHPLGGFDGLILVKVVTDQIGKSLFLVRDELTKIPPLAELFIPINKFGDQRRSANVINDAYKSDNQILIFPAGLASRRSNGKIADLAWQKHFIQKSCEFHRDVIPVYVSGKNSRFFYWLSNFRKRIGIKFNVEMFLLPDEMFKNRGKSFDVFFGKPIPYSKFDKSKSASEWADEVRATVYRLSENCIK